jgi:hypothetical protein
MPQPPSFVARARRALAGRLDRLADALAVLGERVRAELARTLGDVAAEAVRDGVDRHLDRPAPRPACLPRPSPAPRPLASWDEPDEPPWPGADPDNLFAADLRPAPPAGPTPPPPPRPGRWREAAAAGLQVLAWLLRRSAGGLAAVAALGAGLAAALAAWAAPTLVGSSLALLGYSEMIREGARALARPF